MKEYKTILSQINQRKKDVFFIYYSGNLPRITSIAVLNKESLQMYNFSMHLIAEQLNIKPGDINKQYDEIEKVMLERFFNFVSRRKEESFWIYWDMTNINFGFEQLELRYKVLTGKDATSIYEKSKCNLPYLLTKKYGPNYSKDPKMLNLMMLNYKLKSSNFLSDEEEVAAYKTGDFIKLYNSTICKVYFLKYIFKNIITNNLITDRAKLTCKTNKLTQNPVIKILVIISSILGITGFSLVLVLLFLGISF